MCKEGHVKYQQKCDTTTVLHRLCVNVLRLTVLSLEVSIATEDIDNNSYRVAPKVSHNLLSISSQNSDRFSYFFSSAHMCNKVVTIIIYRHTLVAIHYLVKY